MRTICAAVIAIACFMINGCKESAEEITGEVLQEKILASAEHSAKSWWVIAEDEQNYFLMEKDPLSKRYYKVSKADVVISFESGRAEFPVNLKLRNITFRHRTSEPQRPKH